MKKIAPAAALLLAFGLSACTSNGDGEAINPKVDESSQKYRTNANSGEIDPETREDRGAQEAMKNWITENLDDQTDGPKGISWLDKRFAEAQDLTANDDKLPVATTLTVEYLDVTEEAFEARMSKILRASGYEKDRYECANVRDEDVKGGEQRICAISFEEGELVGNDLFSVEVVWNSYTAESSNDGPVQNHVAVTLKDSPQK